MKVKHKILALTLCLLVNGCKKGSNTNISEEVSSILNSLSDYETQLKRIRRYQIESTVVHLDTDRSGKSDGQNDKFLTRIDGDHSIQKHELQVVNEGGKIGARYEFWTVQNLSYRAELDVKENQFAVKKVSERRPSNPRVPRFLNEVVSEILTSPAVPKWVVKKTGGHSVNIKGVFTQDITINTEEYHSINMDFELTDGFWLPSSIEAVYLDSNSVKSRSMAYVWSEFENLPRLVETAHRRLDRSGSNYSCQTKSLLTRLQEPLNHSHCYLTHYGFPEPPGSENEHGSSTWLIAAVVISIVFFCLIFRMYRAR